MRRRVWAVTGAMAALMAAGPAQAYYHYIYYASRVGNFNPIPAQFNLAALPYSTVSIFVDDNGPSTFYPNDTFGSVLGELKSAAAAWNAVPNSALRVAFGGLETAGQAANTPGIEVEFSELPPGLLGLGTPNLPATPADYGRRADLRRDPARSGDSLEQYQPGLGTELDRAVFHHGGA